MGSIARWIVCQRWKADSGKKLFWQAIAQPKLQTLIHTMEEIAYQHPNANVAKVVINWCLVKGMIPIPEARALAQVRSNYAALSWNLIPGRNCRLGCRVNQLFLH